MSTWSVRHVERMCATFKTSPVHLKGRHKEKLVSQRSFIAHISSLLSPLARSVGEGLEQESLDGHRLPSQDRRRWHGQGRAGRGGQDLRNQIVLLDDIYKISKLHTRPPAAVKEAAVMGSKVGAGAAMEGAKRARQASRIKP